MTMRMGFNLTLVASVAITFLATEEVRSAGVNLTIRASGSRRYPGDRGLPIVYVSRPNALGLASDDCLTLTVVVDNPGPGPFLGDLDVCFDRSVISPKLGIAGVTGLFAIPAPIAFPVGRSIFQFDVDAPVLKTRLDTIHRRLGRPVNLPVIVLLDDPAVNVDPCVLEGIACVDSETRTYGLRRQPIRADDGTAEGFETVNVPTRAGDSFIVRCRWIDLPAVPFMIVGIEIVGTSVGGSGGLDAVELRQESFLQPGCPDMSTFGLLYSVGVRDGTAEGIAFGAVPSTLLLPVGPAIAVDPALAITDLYLLAVFLPDEDGTGPLTSIGVDRTPETIVGDSLRTSDGANECSGDSGANYMLRLVIG